MIVESSESVVTVVAVAVSTGSDVGRCEMVSTQTVPAIRIDSDEVAIIAARENKPRRVRRFMEVVVLGFAESAVRVFWNRCRPLSFGG